MGLGSINASQKAVFAFIWSIPGRSALRVSFGCYGKALTARKRMASEMRPRRPFSCSFRKLQALFLAGELKTKEHAKSWLESAIDAEIDAD